MGKCCFQASKLSRDLIPGILKKWALLQHGPYQMWKLPTVGACWVTLLVQLTFLSVFILVTAGKWLLINNAQHWTPVISSQFPRSASQLYLHDGMPFIHKTFWVLILHENSQKEQKDEPSAFTWAHMDLRMVWKDITFYNYDIWQPSLFRAAHIYTTEQS